MWRTFIYSVLGSLFLLSNSSFAASYYEINGDPSSIDNAPIAEYIKAPGEKIILIDPREHFFGAYSPSGKLLRWGLATSGADWCRDMDGSCHTKTGFFRIYSLGNNNCISKKYPIPDGGAPMPYCMYFANGQAIHGSDEVEYGNASHGCVRVNLSDAKWLRFHFVEGPAETNHFQGTRVIIKSY